MKLQFLLIAGISIVHAQPFRSLRELSEKGDERIAEIMALSEDQPYEILGLHPTADITKNDIRNAWGETSLLVHPDENLDNAQANEAFHRQQKAYETLTEIYDIYEETVETPENVLGEFHSGDFEGFDDFAEWFYQHFFGFHPDDDHDGDFGGNRV